MIGFAAGTRIALAPIHASPYEAGTVHRAVARDSTLYAHRLALLSFFLSALSLSARSLSLSARSLSLSRSRSFPPPPRPKNPNTPPPPPLPPPFFESPLSGGTTTTFPLNTAVALAPPPPAPPPPCPRFGRRGRRSPQRGMRISKVCVQLLSCICWITHSPFAAVVDSRGLCEEDA